MSSTAETVLGHHLQAIAALQLDDIMSDFTPESVLFSQNGVFRGIEQIRVFYSEAMKIFTPDVISQMQFTQQEVSGEFAYIVWSAGTTVPFGSDTFHIHDGKIMMQSFVAQLAL